MKIFLASVARAIAITLALALFFNVAKATQVEKVRIAVCVESLAEKGEPACPNGRAIGRVLSAPNSVIPVTRHPQKFDYRSGSLVLHLYLTDEGVVEPPRPKHLQSGQIHTDSVWVYFGSLDNFDEFLKNTLEIHSAQPRSSPAYDPQSKGRYMLNTRRDPVFNVYEYRIGDRLVGGDGPYPVEILHPKKASNVLIVCVKSITFDGASFDPACSVDDMRNEVRITYSLRRSRIGNWPIYSGYIREYIDSISSVFMTKGEGENNE